jgi:hypothetical protein
MERCADHDKISEAVIRMEEKLDSAICKVTEHIEAGSKWRLAITISCIGLVGTIIGGIVRFSLMEYKIASLQDDGREMQRQVYDLNYEQGRFIGLTEKNKNAMP